MPPDHPSPQERAVAIAKKVDHLFSLNRDYFLSNVEIFKQEDTARKEREKNAEKTSDKAAQAIVNELEAIKAGKATPSLTDKKNRPGPGWEWQTVFPNSKDGAPVPPHMVEGWIPPEAARAKANLSEVAEGRLYWPGPPTLATMVALLAALHDECLPDSPPIFDPASSKPLSVAQAQELGLWALYGARLWCVCAKQGATDRLDALETYLNHVKAALEVQTAKRNVPPGKQPNPEELRRMEAADPVLSEPPQYRDSTWPGVFVEEGNGLPARWMAGASPDWRINYTALAERAEDTAANLRKSAAERKSARELATLLRRYIALETPRILEGCAAREYLDEMDRLGNQMQALAVRVGLASAAQPVYVSSAMVRGRVLDERLARQKQIMMAWAEGGARQTGDEKAGGRQGVRDVPQASPTAPVYEFKIVGEVWHVRFEGEYGEIVDRVGMARLCTLLLKPNPAEAITALRLCGFDELGTAERHVSHQQVLDGRALREFRDKLAELNADIEEANNSGNVAKAEDLARDREAILEELRKDRMGRRKGKELGPKDAKAKAAEAVAASLKTVYKALRQQGLMKAADHLSKAIKIESYAFAYRPGPNPPDWHF